MTEDGTEQRIPPYIVTWNDGEEVFATRAEAVARAKDLSAERRVQVEREDGVETMQFFAGSLETFIYETRDRRRRPKD